MAVNIKKNVLLLIGGYVGTIAGAGAAGYLMYDKYKEARDQEADLKKQVELAEIKIKRVPSLETDVICLRENVDELVKILPDTKEVNEFVNKLNDFSTESGVQISSLKPDKDRSKEKEVFDKVIYRVSMEGNLDHFLNFLSLCEGWERFVRVTSIEVKAGDWNEDMAREEVVHEISVDLETYAYRGHDDPNSLTTNIPNYERRRETLRDEIVSRRAEIRVERYTLVPNPIRRDPFVDPRRRLTDDTGDGLPYFEQRSLVEDFVFRAVELSELTNAVNGRINFIRRLELEKAIDEKTFTLQADVDDALAAHSVSDVSLKRRIEREVMPVLKSILERDKNATAAATVEDLRAFASEMASLVEDGQYKAAIKKYEFIEGRVDPDALSAEGAELLHLIQRAATKAEVALDFEGKDIEIGGAIVAADRSVVVVNGRVLKEGDALEENLKVHHIEADRVEFEYRGVILARAR